MELKRKAGLLSRLIVSVNRWIVFNWNLMNRFSDIKSVVSVNRWIVFNWNKNEAQRHCKSVSVSVNRWIVFNWNYTSPSELMRMPRFS